VSARHRRIRSGLVVAEIAVALVLLVGAGLLLRSFAALTRVSPGFKPEKLLLVNLPLSPLKSKGSRFERRNPNSEPFEPENHRTREPEASLPP
jgi:hypothetical protein